MKQPLTGRSATRPTRPPPSAWARVPVAAWIVLAVVVLHLAFFWLVADKHYLPKTRKIPPAPPANFGARAQTSVDPATGETITERQFVVSTRFASPSPPPRSSATPAH